MKTRTTNINDKLYNMDMRTVLAGLAIGYDLKTLKREHALARKRLLKKMGRELITVPESVVPKKRTERRRRPNRVIRPLTISGRKGWAKMNKGE